jgi:hypothetical protein
MDVNTIIHADVFLRKFSGCPVELYVNDIPVARAGGQQQPFASVPVPEYLVDGENTLTLVIGCGSTPSTAKTGPCEWGETADSAMEAVARIAVLQEGMMAGPGAGEALMELTWTGEAQDALPKVVTVTADLGEQFGDWAWQSAEVLTLDDATKKSAIAFIEKIKASFEQGKFNDIVAVGQAKFDEAERSYPIYEKGMMAAMFAEEMGQMTQHPKWKPGEMSRDEYDLRLVAGGRMIDPVAKDWRPIVRMAEDQFAYFMMIGRIDGEWQILR